MEMPGNIRNPNLFGSISAVNSLNGSNNLENRFLKMKMLVTAVEQYLETRNDDQLNMINQYLQGLSLSLDLSLYDPDTNMAGNFFLSIYELMNNLEPRSLTSWHCVDVLLNCCKNSGARKALMTTYKFLPCLARMMCDQLATKKKVSLLRLMQNITCGIKIQWQIPHITHLITSLCKWIERQQPDHEVLELSLAVLVNLCYKNVSSVYILQHHTDLKKFIRMCLSLKGMIVELYVCEMALILEDISGYIPGVLFPKLIDNTFMACIETYRKRDNLVFKQVIEFFMVFAKNNPAMTSALAAYDKYGERVGSILEVRTKQGLLLEIPLKNHFSQLIERSSDQSDQDLECVEALLEFIDFLIEAKVPQISSLYGRIIPLALNWMQEMTTSYRALSVLRDIAINVDQNESKILEFLMASLRMFMFTLKCCQDEKMMASTEFIKRLGALLQLLTAMIQVESMREKVMQEIQQDVFRSIFASLLGDSSPRSGDSPSSCKIEAVNLYLYALALLAKLAERSNEWLDYLNELLHDRQIHVVIAQAISRSPPNVKQLALELSLTCSRKVSSALANLQSFMSTDTCGHLNISADVGVGLIPVVQSERLNILLENIEKAIARNEIDNVATSELMECYNFKISYLAQAERAALSSLEASTKHCTHLQHRISRLTPENARLQQSELHITRKLEEVTTKAEDLENKLRNFRNKCDAEKGRYKVLHSQFLEKDKALGECRASLADAENQLAKLQSALEDLEETRKKQEKQEQLAKEQITKAEESNKNLATQIQDLEKTLREKEKLLKDTRIDLELKTNIINNITRMATSSLAR
uniref:Protein CIP2A n=1 Tax=Dendroctonus ponderosae TaxID=77166 RepID=A0AAR5PBZ4_DENPD